MALARIIAPQGLMNTQLKSRAVKEGARVLKATLGVGGEEDDTGIFTRCVEIDDGQCNLFAMLNSIDFETNPPNVYSGLAEEWIAFYYAIDAIPASVFPLSSMESTFAPSCACFATARR